MSPLNSAKEDKKYWRSLSELSETEEFQEFVSREFQDVDVGQNGSVSRRRFMQLMGASLTLTGATGCWEKEKILPHTRRPAGVVPGKSKMFTSVMDMAGVGLPLSVTSFDGRPIKVDGNKNHPSTSGGSTGFAQASILDIYDPDRLGKVLRRNGGSAATPSDWSAFEEWAKPHFAGLAASAGKGLTILSEANASLSVAAQKAKLMASMPEAQWVEYEAISDENARAASRLAFGGDYRSDIDLTKAHIIVDVDAGLLSAHPNHIQHSRDWGSQRNPEAGKMNRMYAIESRMTNTGMGAEHRLGLRHEQIKSFMLLLEAELAAQGVDTGAPKIKVGKFSSDKKVQKWVKALSKDLVKHQGNCVVAVGDQHPADVIALGHRLNVALGNMGKSVSLRQLPEQGRQGHSEGLKAVTEAMNAGTVDTLLILGGNPSYSAPADVDFAGALSKVKNSIFLTVTPNETSLGCSWSLPRTHYLETWNESRTWDGTVSIAQPLIEPLFDGRAVAEVLAFLRNDPASSLALTRAVFSGLASPAEPVAEKAKAEATTETEAPAVIDVELAALPKVDGAEWAWRKAIHDGFIKDTAYPVVQPELLSFVVSAPSKRADLTFDELKNGEFELTFFADSKVHDGRFANNGWLQEVPDFLTKLTWDNAAILSPATAKRLGVEDEDLIKLRAEGVELEIAALVVPGQPTGSISLAIGYGRTAAGFVGGYTELGIAQQVVGVDVQPLRLLATQHQRNDLVIEKTGKKFKLACTQEHHNIDQTGLEEREKRALTLIRESTLAEYTSDPKRFKNMDHYQPSQLLSLFDEHEYKDIKWGMSIDLTNCNGCNACVIACNAENIVPVVGKDQVLRGREMHWMRIDRYFAGDPEDPQVLSQPVSCVQCQNAPCEQVCPVAATVHSEEGLNDMVYNRCIGTRYCANNCPFKVRRFNYHNYHEELKDPVNKVKTMGFNPEVTVRFRGVMEKCTYCVQRISAARHDARNENRPMDTENICAACEDACATNAIAFGDLNNKNSRVSKMHASNRSYAMLAELNIKPRTEFLARIRNTNPELSEG
jgi:molybdopterin-containing oxidoreductase family iron-sulfur binding subunit